jgi:hypothetical protein
LGSVCRIIDTGQGVPVHFSVWQGAARKVRACRLVWLMLPAVV